MADLTAVLDALSSVLRTHAAGLDIKHDTPGGLYIDTRHVMKNGKPLFFGAVQLRKNYVSYHLMPVYTDPDLLDTVSPALRARMQGKSCFNLRSLEPQLVEELSALTGAGLARYAERGYV